MAIRIIGRLLLLVAVFLLLNAVYGLTFYENDFREKCPQVHEIRRSADSADIYYFGESSNVTYKENDSLLESISELTARFYPSKQLRTITKYASHAGLYRYWINEVCGAEKKPQAVIVTMNLRSFGAAWIHSNLESALKETVVLAQPFPRLANRFLLSLRAFDHKTDEQREQDMLQEWRKPSLPERLKFKSTADWDYHFSQGYYLKPDGSWDLPRIELACHYIKAYSFQVNDRNPRVQDFDAISRACEKAGIKLYLNVMSENVQYADSLVGGELVFLMRENRDYLVRRYTSANCVVVDNLELVKGSEFIDQNWTTEHYDYRGRMRIARNLATRLKEQFSQEFFPAY